MRGYPSKPFSREEALGIWPKGQDLRALLLSAEIKMKKSCGLVPSWVQNLSLFTGVDNIPQKAKAHPKT